MSKLKLNIQYFGSTNKTTHYNLSQYVASDKPTYLVDYNSDMLAIDTAIYNAMSKATVNETNIGTMTDLTTDSKSDLVSAINEIDSHTDTNTNNITQNTTDIASNTGNIGNLINLNTTAKNNLVSAINEVKGVNDTQNTSISSLNDEIQKFNLSTFTNYATADMSTTNGSIVYGDVTLATNSDGSIFKLYGSIALYKSGSNNGIVTIPTSLRPSSNIIISGAGLTNSNNGSQISRVVPLASFTVKTNGDIEIPWSAFNEDYSVNIMLFACLYFLKDFGDVTPTPSN